MTWWHRWKAREETNTEMYDTWVLRNFGSHPPLDRGFLHTSENGGCPTDTQMTPFDSPWKMEQKNVLRPLSQTTPKGKLRVAVPISDFIETDMDAVTIQERASRALYKNV